MQQGELTVTGHDHAIIPLHRRPSRVEAYFKDTNVPVPCNPHHFDELRYDVHVSNQHASGFVLKISWRVSGVREIVWRAH
jgi:hypothetical protein